MEIELKNVTKSYRHRSRSARSVLSDLNFSVTSGSATVLSGPSGSGKTTMLNLIAGLHLCDLGSVRVGPHVLSEMGESKRDRFRARHIGYVYQTFNLLTPLSALENLLIPARLIGAFGPDTKARAQALLEELGLGDELHKRPYELSVGQRQRVAVARAVLKKPDVLVADEPTASLDKSAAKAVISALGALVRGGATLIAATHDPALTEALGAKVFAVDEGRWTA